MELSKLREQIDEIDLNLVELLVKRFQISKEIGNYKKNNKLEIKKEKREKELVLDKIDRFNKQGFLDVNFVKDLFELIMKQSRGIQL